MLICNRINRVAWTVLLHRALERDSKQSRQMLISQERREHTAIAARSIFVYCEKEKAMEEEKSESVRIRISLSEREQLKAFAERHGVTMSDVLRAALVMVAALVKAEQK